MKISIRDFQSLSEADIEVEGLTVITGKTNGGKTAVVRALEESIFNRGDDSHVRAGSNESEITIEDDGHTMTYRRNAGKRSEKTSYSFDGGREIRKVGRDQLPEVRDMFHISDVKMSNGQHAVLNFWEQNDRPFLMDKTPQQLYEFLSLSSAKKYTAVLKKMKKDAKDTRTEVIGEKKVLEELRRNLAERRAYLRSQDGFDELFDSIQNIDARDRRNAYMSEISDECGHLNEQMNAIEKTLETVPVLPDIDISEILSKETVQEKRENTLSETASFAKRAREVAAEMHAVPEYPEISIDEIVEHERRTKASEQHVSEVDELENRIAELKSEIRSFPVLPEQNLDSIRGREETLRRHIDMYNDTAGIHREISRLHEAIERMPLFPDVDMESFEQRSQRLEKITAEMTSLEELRKQYESAKKAYGAAEIEARRSEEELRGYERTIGVCPLCGRPFDDHKNINKEEDG